MSKINQREKQANATRERLVLVGYELFGSKGYADVSSEEIVKQANVTRGALYHHFKKGKIGLFEVVAEKELSKLVLDVAKKIRTHPLKWDSLRPALEAYFHAAMRDEHRRIALRDAPSVLGAEKWRALEYDYSVKLIQSSLEQLMSNAVLRPVSVEALASIIFGACCEAILEIAASETPEETKQDSLDIIMQLLGGIRI